MQDNSPASLAGLREGDVILRYNGQKVIDYNHLINLVSMSPIGETADLVVWRDRKPQALKIAIADRAAVIPKSPTPPGPLPDGLLRRPPRPEPTPSNRADDRPRGLGLIAIDEAAAARRYGLADSVRGVLVTQVDPSSPLAPFLKPFDLIETVGGRNARSADDVRKAIAGRPEGEAIAVVLLRPEQGSLERKTVRIP